MEKMKELSRKFIINERCWHTMQQFAKLAYDEDSNEISGLLHVRKATHPVDKSLIYELFDPIILEQENTGTTTELDGDAIRDYTVKAGMKYGTDIKFCWWHSHHTMGAFWSGTDENEIKAWKNDSWSIALVVNLRQEYKLNISVWDPVEYSKDVPLEIIRHVPQITSKQKKEYEKLCSTANPIVTTIPGNGWTKSYNNYAKNQISLLNLKEEKGLLEGDSTIEKLKWLKSESILPYSELINLVDEELDEVINDSFQGTINYEEYSLKIDDINKSLKKRNAKFKIKKIKKGKLLEEAATMQTWEHFKFESEKIEAIYDRARLSHYQHYDNGGWLWA